MKMAEEEEVDEYTLNSEELEIFYHVLFNRIMDIMKRTDSDPFEQVIAILSRLSGIFSFKSMISLIPELVGNAMRYGMMVEKAFEEKEVEISEEDEQGLDADELEQERRMALLKKDIDKLNLYL
jgi:hypothetical protein